MLTLVKRSTEKYNASFTARSWDVSITDYKRSKNINLKIKKKTCQLISTKLATMYNTYF